MQARQQYLEDKEARDTARTSPDRPITDLDLGKRATEALAKAEITTVGQIMDLLVKGEAAVLAIEGFGRKSLSDMKKRLRGFGYELPEAAEEIVV
ncbi:MAG TPA: DNA-directed RNA polymerase subunit alpha C-terminal domain-containing protein [Anaerolineales bacterium]|nr:DNA-directed RNA polymerase subunit alpha C-terminal domain-containing protein [Anaerolineales bacterium]